MINNAGAAGENPSFAWLPPTWWTRKRVG